MLRGMGGGGNRLRESGGLGREREALFESIFVGRGKGS